MLHTLVLKKIVPKNISCPGSQLQVCTTTQNVEGLKQKVYYSVNVLVYLNLAMSVFPLGYVVSIGVIAFLAVMLLCYIMVCVCALVFGKFYSLLALKQVRIIMCIMFQNVKVMLTKTKGFIHKMKSIQPVKFLKTLLMTRKKKLLFKAV